MEMTFTRRNEITRESAAVETFFQGYGLRLSSGRLLADRTGSRPETFNMRADAERAALEINRRTS